jgi:Pyridoxamine 5'-phosphate oxidase
VWLQVAVLGQAKAVPVAEYEEVAAMMFSRHPQMKAWVLLAHEWAFYELHVDHAYVIDWFGGYNIVSREDYFAALPSKPL